MRKLLVLTVILLWLTACTQPTDIPTPVDSSEEFSEPEGTVVVGDRVRAEGVVEPARTVVLRAERAGILADVLIEEGSIVSAGDVLLRFDTTDDDLAIQQAEAALAGARARLALVWAGPRPEDVAIMDAQVMVAQAMISQTAALRQAYYAGGTSADIAEAQAQLAEAEVAYQNAIEAHEQTMTCYDVPQSDGSTQEICPALGTLEEIARFQEQAAYTGVLAAQANLDAVRGAVGAGGGEVQANEQSAIAQRDALLAQLALLEAGSSAEAIAAAEAQVRQAEIALDAAMARRAQSELTAPFAGVVTSLPVDAGDALASGDALVTLATLDDLRVLTRDLAELDVAQIAVGQPAVVTLDAHPDHALAARVARIERQSTTYLGDVVYPVVVTFEGAAPDWLRWGMTAQVEVVEGEAEVPATAGGNIPAPDGNLVIAEARIEPVAWGEVSFAASGRVAEVLVEAGETVEAGQKLVRLDDTHAVLAVQEAEAALAAARADLALAQAPPQAAAIEAAESELAVEASDLAAAEARYRQIVAGGSEAKVAAVRAELEAARAERRHVEALVEWVENGGDAGRAEDLRQQLRVIDKKIEAAEAKLAAAPRTFGAQVVVAQAGIVVAEAQYAVAEAELALAGVGGTDEEIAIAEAAVQQAAAALAVAEADLARMTIRAPFAGTVIQLAVEVGDLVAPGQAVLVVATLDQWQARTTDLQELAVVHVAEGQAATVSIDALPDVTLRGSVVQVGLESEDYRGDVTYPVVIELENADSETLGDTLYWGMTALVEIAVP